MPLQPDDKLVGRLRELVWRLIENDPDEPVADNGCTVFDLWRGDAINALAALASPSVPDRQWQPIETAPKDGSDILILAYGMAVEARYSPGRWSEETPLGPAEYDGAVWCCFDDEFQFEIEEGALGNGGDCHFPVTHWMPLPPPPAPQDRGASQEDGRA